jgi:hypothetical protein
VGAATATTAKAAAAATADAVATVKTQASRAKADPAAKAAMAGGGRTVTEAAAGRRELASPLPRLVVATAGRAAWGPLQT